MHATQTCPYCDLSGPDHNATRCRKTASVYSAVVDGHIDDCARYIRNHPADLHGSPQARLARQRKLQELAGWVSRASPLNL